MDKIFDIEKINKFKQKFKDIWKKLRIALYVLPEVVMAFASAGCSEAKADVIPEKTPIEQNLVVKTPTVTFTPTPTKAPTPKPTPTPELTFEQKKLMLGIDKDFDSYALGNIVVFNYNLNNKKRRVWTVFEIDSEKPNVQYFYNMFNYEYLFSMTLPENAFISTGNFCQYMDSNIAALDGIKYRNSTSPLTIPLAYKGWGENYNNNQNLNEMCERYQNSTSAEEDMQISLTPFSMDELVDLYISSTPQDELCPFWEYVPGAEVPDELKEIFPNVTPLPLPEESMSPEGYPRK